MSVMDVKLPGDPGGQQAGIEPGDLQGLTLQELAVDEDASRVVARLTRTAVPGGAAPVRTAAFNAFIG